MNNALPPIAITLVIPCYNEADRIGLLYEGIASFLPRWPHTVHIIIVNDGSRDNTLQLLQQHPVYQAHQDIIQILSQQNTGKGGALKQGVAAVGDSDYILTLDADMATPPAELVKWMVLLNNAPKRDTIYIGSREHKDSVIKNQGDRKIAGNIFNRIVRLLTPLRYLEDTQCGFKLYPAAVAKDAFARLQTEGWAHDVELLYRAHLNSIKIVEMPLTWNAVEGSKINLFRDGVKMLLETIRIVFTTKR